MQYTVNDTTYLTSRNKKEESLTRPTQGGGFQGRRRPCIYTRNARADAMGTYFLGSQTFERSDPEVT